MVGRRIRRSSGRYGGAVRFGPGPERVLGPTVGLIPASPALTDLLELNQTRVTAGTPIKGTLLVINHGRTAIDLNSRCQPKYAVVLTDHKFPRSPLSQPAPPPLTTARIGQDASLWQRCSCRGRGRTF